MDPCLKLIKNKAKLWLQIWHECGRLSFVSLADLKCIPKTDYERYLRSAVYHGMDFCGSCGCSAIGVVRFLRFGMSPGVCSHCFSFKFFASKSKSYCVAESRKSY